MDTLSLRDVAHLSVAEKIQLVEDLWDSIAAAPEKLELSSGQQRELDRRLAAHQASSVGSSWEEVKARLQD